MRLIYGKMTNKLMSTPLDRLRIHFEWHVFTRLGQTSLERTLYCIYSFIPIAGNLDVCNHLGQNNSLPLQKSQISHKNGRDID